MMSDQAERTETDGHQALAHLEARVNAIMAKLDWEVPRMRAETQQIAGQLDNVITSSATTCNDVNKRLAAIEAKLGQINAGKRRCPPR